MQAMRYMARDSLVHPGHYLAPVSSEEYAGLPADLLETLESVPGYERAAFLKAHEEEPPTSVRLHPLKGSGLLSDAALVPWCASGRYLPQRPLFTADPLYHAGAYYVQEASSMFLHHAVKTLLPDAKHLRVLDLCGAPGGKSTLLAAALDTTNLILSNDVIRSRATILDENMTRWGYTNAWVTSNDPRDFGRLAGYFDLIVVDAPCSGSGLFRKYSDWRAGWSADDVLMCNARQQRILADAWPSLKEGGILMYATCSYSTEEDEAILDVLANTFSVESLAIPHPADWGITGISSGGGMQGYRFWPHLVKGEGFFMAALRKKEAAPAFLYPRGKGAHSKIAAQQSGYLLEGIQTVTVPDDRGAFTALYPYHEPDYTALSERLYLRKAGTPLGEPSRKEWMPAHATALCNNVSHNLPRQELLLADAIRYLRKDELILPAATPKGWVIASYEGRGLGWMKVLSNRINNYLPKHWRIRMDLDGD